MNSSNTFGCCDFVFFGKNLGSSWSIPTNFWMYIHTTNSMFQKVFIIQELKISKYTSQNIFFAGMKNQLMVNWWFGLVLWIFGIPLCKGLLLRGIPRTPKPPITH